MSNRKKSTCFLFDLKVEHKSWYTVFLSINGGYQNLEVQMLAIKFLFFYPDTSCTNMPINNFILYLLNSKNSHPSGILVLSSIRKLSNLSWVIHSTNIFSVQKWQVNLTLISLSHTNNYFYIIIKIWLP